MNKGLFLILILIAFNIALNLQAKAKPEDTLLINHGALYPQFPDLFYEYKLAGLNAQTPVELEYNCFVKDYILIYINKRREQISEVLGLSEFYFPIFEEYLDKYNLPLELKYLPVVESALDPRAQSSTGAMGLWQFKLSTAKMFDLQVTSYIDERCDPYKSTDAACRYLKYLFNIFNDWNLALAAYNSGPGEIRNAIERSGGKNNFWQLFPFLSDQARKYVPAFISINYIMNFYGQHQIKPKKMDYSFFDVDTLNIKHPINFKTISDNISLPVESIRFLNHAYKLDFIPANGHTMILILPENYLVEFVKAEKKIYSTSTSVFDYRENFDFVKENEKSKKIIHIVDKGEFLHKIALKYHGSIDEIMKWNNLSSHVIHEGQQLEIWVKDEY